MLLIDEYIRMWWVGFLKVKGYHFEKFKIFKAMVENEMDLKIQCFTFDRERKFISNEFFDFLDQHGIKRQFSIAQNPQQNGFAERMKRTFQQMPYAMFDDIGLSHPSGENQYK